MIAHQPRPLSHVRRKSPWSSIVADAVERGDFSLGMSGMEDRPELRARHAVTICRIIEFREVLAVRHCRQRALCNALKDLRGKRVATLGQTTAYSDSAGTPRTASASQPVSRRSTTCIRTPILFRDVWIAVLLDNIIAERSLRRTGGFVDRAGTPVAIGHYVGVLQASA